MPTVHCPHCPRVLSHKTENMVRHSLQTHIRLKHPAMNTAATPTVIEPPPKPKPTRRNKIRWEPVEYQLVVEATAERRITHPFESLAEAVQEAQKILPLDRHRVINTTTCLPNFPQKVQLAFDSLIHSTKPEQPAPEPVIHTIPVEVTPPLEKILPTAATGALIAELATRLFRRIDRLEAALAAVHKNGAHTNGIATARAAEPPVALIPRATTPEPARKPRIVIGGLMKDQFEHVKEKLKEKDVELVWIDTTARTSTTYPMHVDAIVLTKHIGHHWSDAATRAIGQAKVFHADGQSSVVQRVFDFLSRRNPITAHS